MSSSSHRITLQAQAVLRELVRGNDFLRLRVVRGLLPVQLLPGSFIERLRVLLLRGAVRDSGFPAGLLLHAALREPRVPVPVRKLRCKCM